MGLDKLYLRVLPMFSEGANKQKNAKKVLDLMQRGRHWVLVVVRFSSAFTYPAENCFHQVLLLGNVIIYESLPVFLDSAVRSLFSP
jgi:metal transporter CNNM